VWKAENAFVPLILPIEIASGRYRIAIIMGISQCSMMRGSEVFLQINKAP